MAEWLNPQLVPEGMDVSTSIFYGGRWIAPDDNLGDREGVSQYGNEEVADERKAFIDWINGGPFRAAKDKSRELHNNWVLQGSKSDIVTLYEDDYGVIIASDFSSYGYTYVGAFRRRDLPAGYTPPSVEAAV